MFLCARIKTMMLMKIPSVATELIPRTWPDVSVWRAWTGSLLEAPIPTLECYKLLTLAIVKTDWWGAGVVVCLEQGETTL